VNKKPKQAKKNGVQTETTKIPNNELWNQLGHAVTMASKEDQIVWAIFGVFWAANAVLLVGLFTTGKMPSAKVGVVISTIGIVLSCVWFIIQQRAIRWLKYYEKIIYRIEEYEELKIPPDIALSPRVNEKTFIEEVGHGVRVRSIMVASGFFIAISWIATWVWFARLLWLTCK
jgi:hypothetical protein